jgi:hypothetical protein
VAVAFPFGKTKTPPPIWQWGSINLVIESEPDRRAGKQQRVQQQVQIQIANHGGNVAKRRKIVKFFLSGIALPGSHATLAPLAKSALRHFIFS